MQVDEKRIVDLPEILCLHFPWDFNQMFKQSLSTWRVSEFHVFSNIEYERYLWEVYRIRPSALRNLFKLSSILN